MDSIASTNHSQMIMFLYSMMENNLLKFCTTFAYLFIKQWEITSFEEVLSSKHGGIFIDVQPKKSRELYRHN